MGQQPRRRVGAWIAVAVGALVLLAGGAGATCKFTSLDCHLHEGSGWELSMVAGDRGGTVQIIESLQKTKVAEGFDFPTDFDFLPDGSMLVAGKDGLIQRVRNGRIAKTPVLDLRGTVNTSELRGLVALVVEPPRPDEPTQFYVVYTVIDPANPGPNSSSPTTVRVSRFVLDGPAASPESESILLGSITGGSCMVRPDDDCLPADGDHIGADIQFLPDSSLVVSTGDGGRPGAVVGLSQSLDSLSGKVLRVTRSGKGLPDNPFFNGDPDANRSKVWASGLRNPFRMSLLPDGTIVAGDVGDHDVEELNIVQRGADFGWPCFEGVERAPTYKDTAFCKSYYRRHARSPNAPWIALAHPQYTSVTAGVSLASASALPDQLQSMYLFADWGASKVLAADPGTIGGPTLGQESLRTVESGAAGPVRFRVGPDGALYELAINTGEIHRITATP